MNRDTRTRRQSKPSHTTTTAPQVLPPVVVPSTPMTPFDWNSASGRQPMDLEKIMGAVMPLAGQAQLPTNTTPAPPFSGNFWKTVISPDTLMNKINAAPKDSSSPFGVNMGALLTDTGGKTGTPAQTVSDGHGSVAPPSSSTGGETNPAMLQMFLQSGMMDKLKNVFSPGGVDPSTMTGGGLPYY